MTDKEQLVFEQLAQLADDTTQVVVDGLLAKIDSLNDIELNSLLIKACENQQPKIFKFFKRHARKIGDGLPVLCRTAIHTAARFNMASSFALLCGIYDSRVNYVDERDDFTHFQAACKIGHERLAETLLSHGAKDDLNHVLNSLVKARPKPQVLDLLLRRGARAELTDARGATMLSRLCRQYSTNSRFAPADKPAYLEIIRIMIRHKANVDAFDQEGVTPIQNLYRYGILAPELQFDTLKILLEAGADVKHVNGCGETILHYVLRRHYHSRYHGKVFDLPRANPEIRPVLRLLVQEHGADVNAMDAAGQTPLSCAVSVCNLDAVKLLLELGADPLTVTFEGGFLEPGNEFLRNLEMTRNILEIVEILREKGFEMSERHEVRLLKFLLGFTTVQSYFSVPYVLALASNASAIRSRCNVLAAYQHGVKPVHRALDNHLKIVDHGIMYMNRRTKNCMIEMMVDLEEGMSSSRTSTCSSGNEESESKGKKSSVPPKKPLRQMPEAEIHEEIERARKTMIKETVSLLDVCTCAPHEAYLLLEGSTWESLFDNTEGFAANFNYIGPTIKGYVTRALVRQFFDRVKPSVAVHLLDDEYL